MKLFIKQFIYLNFAVFFFCQNVSFGQDLLSSTLEDEKDFLVYTKVKAGHLLKSKRDFKGGFNHDPRLRITPTIGAKLFGESFDVSLESYFDRKSETTAIEQSESSKLYFSPRPINWGAYVLAVPEIVHKFAFAGKDSLTEVASVGSLSYASYTTLGDFQAQAEVRLGTFFHGRTQTVSYQTHSQVKESTIQTNHLRKNSELNDIQGPVKHQSYFHQWSFGFTFIPIWSENLSLSLKTWVYNLHQPYYMIDRDQNIESHTQLVQNTRQKLRISYYLDERFTLSNEFNMFQKGFFKTASVEPNDNYTNELSLTYAFN